MSAAFFKALLVLAVPAGLFFVAGYAMSHYTGRDQFVSNAVQAVPLNFRMGGYGVADAIAYWNWLGPEGRLSEQRFLKVDLFFPLLYGGSLLVSLLLTWRWLGRPFGRFWLIAPVVITVLTDWIENLVHLRQLRRYFQGERVESGWIQVASTATSVKIVFFFVSCLLLIALACWLLKTHRIPQCHREAAPAE